ncbi:MAG: NAD(+) synthase [Clostridiales bacterium]|nr:NAD(+) synthase [Clostridiales bacterium]
MKYGFIKVGVATPKIEVANCSHNSEKIISLIEGAILKQVEILVFPELCLTGYTCNDLFFQDILIDSAREGLLKIVDYTKGTDILVVVGLPFLKDYKLYNVAAVIQNGRILAIIPKDTILNQIDVNESRYFNPGNKKPELIIINDYEVPFGTNILIRCNNLSKLVVGVEIGQDLWSPISPSVNHSLRGATLLLNPSASPRIVGMTKFRRDLVSLQSKKLICGYIQADAGDGESTTDAVFTGHNLIAENGKVLADDISNPDEIMVSEIDIEKLHNERNKSSIFRQACSNPLDDDYLILDFSYMDKDRQVDLTRYISPSPFIPDNSEDRNDRCKEILSIQALGLKKRLEHIKVSKVVIGLSGGLDSTLALIVTKKAFDLMNLDPKGIVCVTMPCFGTTDRTYENALKLAEYIGASLREVPIQDAVIQHFKDIGHDINNHDVTYENAQARERTQVLMDISNQVGGIVIGTGDLSELALGWATYNGDHMSMYAVNGSVPKTLVRYLIQYTGDNTDNKELQKVLYDILDTPVSPELLPPVNGEIAQKTEDVVGPYELHDFFIYYALRYGFLPSKIFYLATHAFANKYDKEIIYKWLRSFYYRFFSQQFKRSCLPDGPKVGSVCVSPRSDLSMPSDASGTAWLEELDKIKHCL